MQIKRALSGALAVTVILAAGTAAAQSEVTAQARMVDAENEEVGEAVFTQLEQGVLIRLELRNLPAGWHGVHIHETGICEPPFSSAGGHLNPDGESHGFADRGLHAGDLPNIHVGEDGTAKVEMFNNRIALIDRQSREGLMEQAIDTVEQITGRAPHNILGGAGAALVVHSGADDYTTDPAGDSGDRIACGVVQRN